MRFMSILVSTNNRAAKCYHIQWLNFDEHLSLSFLTPFQIIAILHLPHANEEVVILPSLFFAIAKIKRGNNLSM